VEDIVSQVVDPNSPVPVGTDIGQISTEIKTMMAAADDDDDLYDEADGEAPPVTKVAITVVDSNGAVVATTELAPTEQSPSPSPKQPTPQAAPEVAPMGAPLSSAELKLASSTTSLASSTSSTSSSSTVFVHSAEVAPKEPVKSTTDASTTTDPKPADAKPDPKPADADADSKPTADAKRADADVKLAEAKAKWVALAEEMAEEVEEEVEEVLTPETKVRAELLEMGFDSELVATVLEKHGADLEACTRALVQLCEWDSMLADLEEMGFEDAALNKKLMVKHNGSVKNTVKDLIGA
jgi:next-to-BRCA1 protein 1